MDAATLRENAASRLGQGNASANVRSIEHIVAVALKRDSRATRKPVDVEAKLASARAMLGANRSGR